MNDIQQTIQAYIIQLLKDNNYTIKTADDNIIIAHKTIYLTKTKRIWIQITDNLRINHWLTKDGLIPKKQIQSNTELAFEYTDPHILDNIRQAIKS